MIEPIVKYDLYIFNNSNTYTSTFLTARADEVGDVTLATRYIDSKLKNWHISREETLSNHRDLKFERVSSK